MYITVAVFCPSSAPLLVLYKWIPKTTIPFMAQWTSELNMTSRYLLPDYAIHPFDSIIAKVVKQDQLQYLVLVLFHDIILQGF